MSKKFLIRYFPLFDIRIKDKIVEVNEYPIIKRFLEKIFTDIDYNTVSVNIIKEE